MPAVISSRDERSAPARAPVLQGGASAITEKRDVAHELAVREHSRGWRFHDGLALLPGARPSRALHASRLVAQAAARVTEAGSRPIAGHSSIFRAETSATIAIIDCNARLQGAAEFLLKILEGSTLASCTAGCHWSSLGTAFLHPALAPLSVISCSQSAPLLHHRTSKHSLAAPLGTSFPHSPSPYESPLFHQHVIPFAAATARLVYVQTHSFEPRYLSEPTITPPQ